MTYKVKTQVLGRERFRIHTQNDVWSRHTSRDSGKNLAYIVCKLKGRCRKEMYQGFDADPYHQRKDRTIFSAIKRDVWLGDSFT